MGCTGAEQAAWCAQPPVHGVTCNESELINFLDVLWHQQFERGRDAGLDLRNQCDMRSEWRLWQCHQNTPCQGCSNKFVKQVQGDPPPKRALPGSCPHSPLTPLPMSLLDSRTCSLGSFCLLPNIFMMKCLIYQHWPHRMLWAGSQQPEQSLGREAGRTSRLALQPII